MLLGAVIDAGVPTGELSDGLADLNVGGFSLTSRTARRGGVTGTLATVGLDEEARQPRSAKDFIDLTRESGLPAGVADRACAVFRRLGEAEAAAHRVPEEQVALHELGSLDTLVDVVGAVLGFERLGVDRLYSSPLPSGSGVVSSAHGPLPATAPATAELLAAAGVPVVAPPGNAPDAGEMVTPTGAAIVTTLARFRQPAIKLERVAYGLGSRESRHYPNVVALWIGEEIPTERATDLTLIETNIDDMAAELLAYAQERLFDLGAKDVWFTPILMKKSRPATMLSALVPAELESRAVQLMLRETTTLGVRVRPAARYEAERQVVRVETTLGPASVKLKRLAGEAVGVSPEYEDCRRLAMERGMPLQDVYALVQREAAEKLL